MDDILPSDDADDAKEEAQEEEMLYAIHYYDLWKYLNEVQNTYDLFRRWD